MKTIDLEKEKMDLAAVIKIARREPVLLVTSDGRENFVPGLTDEKDTKV